MYIFKHTIEIIIILSPIELVKKGFVADWIYTNKAARKKGRAFFSHPLLLQSL
jgi:hypothetical protein